LPTHHVDAKTTATLLVLERGGCRNCLRRPTKVALYRPPSQPADLGERRLPTAQRAQSDILHRMPAVISSVALHLRGGMLLGGLFI
jgi:hypothetical protein